MRGIKCSTEYLMKFCFNRCPLFTCTIGVMYSPSVRREHFTVSLETFKIFEDMVEAATVNAWCMLRDLHSLDDACD